MASSLVRTSATLVILALAIATIEVPRFVSAEPLGVGPSAPTTDAPGRSSMTSLASAPRSFDPELRTATGRVNILVSMDASAPIAEVASLFESARVLPPTGGVRILRGTINVQRLPDLEAVASVRSVLKDRPIAFTEIPRPPGSVLPADRLRFPFATQAPIERDSLGDGPEVTMYQVVNFTGARRAWTNLGVDGAGVTIAVVDSGVDHGAMDLGDAAVARDASGAPSSFDPDGGTYGRTTLRVTSYTNPSGQTFVRTRNTDPLIYIFDIPAAFGPYGPANVSWSDSRLFGASFPADMEITGMPASRSGTYHFGVLAEWHLILPYIYLDLFPVILIDATVAGSYDTAVLDLSFDWWLGGHQPSPDLSFADETPLRIAGGPFVASRDMDGDGYPDVSAGSLAHGLDIWGLEETASERFRVLSPLDPDGDHVVFVYDWFGHGTSVAATAAGRQTSHPLAGPGIAPGARIMGVPIFFWGDVIEGWLWAAGFDLVDRAIPIAVPDYTGYVRYGTWTYTGNHRADIISNSWGVSDWLTIPWSFGWPWYDVLTVLEDALMTPGYADPAYPGTLIVHAGGNGGAGYGTVTEPSFGSLALAVGASTSLNNTALPFGGFHGDVMSWSARGPNALGAPKPDVVMVGAFAYTAAPPWWGNGTGSDAFTLFGGTSQATPATSGSAAVAIEAFRASRGRAPSPFEIKSILKSTAEDLGYDAFVQGAGQVNVYNAAALAQGREGLLVTSPATWDAERTLVARPWAFTAAAYGQQVGGSPPDGPIQDASWFAGVLRPGGTATADFSLANAGPAGTASLSAVWHGRIASLTRTGTTGTLGPGWLEGYGALVPLLPADVPPGADLMVARASISYQSFDPEIDYVWNNRVRIIVGDWVDADQNNVPAPSEVRVFNYGYNTGTTVEARVGFPQARFSGRPILWFSQLPAPGLPFASIAFTIQVEFYQRVPWPWISIPATSPVPGSVAAALTVPADATQGAYEGQILVRPSVGNGTVIPVSVVVPRVLDGSVLSATLTAPPSTAIYDSSVVQGYFDWRWRYEAGDWRFWYVQVDDPSVIALRVNASWGDRLTDVDLWSLTPGGTPADSSFSPYLGDGVFYWSTRTGRSSDFVVAGTESNVDSPGVGLYTFALHNVLFGSTPPPERLSGQVAIAKLSPRGPLMAHARPGDEVSLRFTLTTGFTLTNIAWLTSPPPGGSTFPGAAWPATVPTMTSGSSLVLYANFTVPAGTADGTYGNYAVFASDQIPLTVVRADIVVDSTPPSVSIVAPGASAVVGGSVAIAAQVSDASALASVGFQSGTSSGPLVFDPPSGTWVGQWDTTAIPDGPATLRVNATDVAGNQQSVARPVVVDNTPPTVMIGAPTTGATVAGTVSIAWSVTDANPGTVVLSIDGALRDVTGNSSYTFDTTRVGDGAHTIEVRAIDRAGNEGTATASITVSNLGATTTGSLLTGFAIGFLLAAVVGFVLGFILARRRRAPPASPPPPPPQSPPERQEGAPPGTP